MMFLLWILAVILVVSGIVSLVRGQMLWGIVLIIVGLRGRPGRLQHLQVAAETAPNRHEGPVREDRPFEFLLYAIRDLNPEPAD